MLKRYGKRKMKRGDVGICYRCGHVERRLFDWRIHNRRVPLCRVCDLGLQVDLGMKR